MPKRIKLFRDKEKARIYRNRQRKKNYDSSRCGRSSWTKEQDNLVLEHGIPDRQLSALIHHSVAAIQMRRVRLKGSESNDGNERMGEASPEVAE